MPSVVFIFMRFLARVTNNTPHVECVLKLIRRLEWPVVGVVFAFAKNYAVAL